jgi:hypothetical protein
MLSGLLLQVLLGKASGERVTIDDIESRFRELTGTATSSAERAKVPAIGGSVAAVVLLLLLVYFLGKRRGRKRSTVVEIRRVV